MAGYPRSEIVNDNEPGIYHCCNQIVQQQYLFGRDALSGRDYSHRKDWVEDEIRRVAQFMAVEFLDFAVMDNHLHFMIRTRPDIARQLSNREVAARWCSLCKTAGLTREERLQLGGLPPRPTERQLQAVLADRSKLAECRMRLSSLSWVMRLICQPIARKANLESGTRGKFFAGRFKSQRIEDEAGLMACSMYINLNPIRAGIAVVPNEPQCTSAYRRIVGILRHDLKGQNSYGETACSSHDPDGWLAPVFLDPRACDFHQIDELERNEPTYSSTLSMTKDLATAEVQLAGKESMCEADSLESVVQSVASQPEVREHSVASSQSPTASPQGPMFRGHRLIPEVFAPRLTNRGFLPFSPADYFELLKWSAEQITGATSVDCSSRVARLLDKVGIDSQRWPVTIRSIGRWFSTSLGNALSLEKRANQRHRCWLKGKKYAAEAFSTSVSVAP